MKHRADQQIDELENQVWELKRKIAELRRNIEPEEVPDYSLKGWEGQQITLSSLFGDRNRLILIHNMGRNCAYCTMWADGFNGVLPHLKSRAAFVVTSPDSPEVQREFAQSRNWRFPMYSVEGTTLFADLGFTDENGQPMPGVSVMTKEADGKLYRVGRAEFGPGDDYCAVWHFLELFPKGVDGWEPRFSYEPVRLSRGRFIDAPHAV